MLATSASKSPISSWSATVSIMRSATAIWTISACSKKSRRRQQRNERDTSLSPLSELQVGGSRFVGADRDTDGRVDQPLIELEAEKHFFQPGCAVEGKRIVFPGTDGDDLVAP